MTQAERAQTRDRDPARAARAHRPGAAPDPTVAWCRRGIRAAAASGKSRSGTAPRPARPETLQDRSRAPLWHPSVDFTPALRPQDGLGKRIDRDVARKKT